MSESLKLREAQIAMLDGHKVCVDHEDAGEPIGYMYYCQERQRFYYYRISTRKSSNINKAFGHKYYRIYKEKKKEEFETVLEYTVYTVGSFIPKTFEGFGEALEYITNEEGQHNIIKHYVTKLTNS